MNNKFFHYGFLILIFLGAILFFLLINIKINFALTQKQDQNNYTRIKNIGAINVTKIIKHSNNGSITGKVFLSNNTLVKSKTGRILFLGKSITTESIVKIDSNGIFTINNRPSGNYEIVIKITDGTINYIGSMKNIHIAKGITTNIGDIFVKPVGYLAYKLIYNDVLYHWYLKYANTNLSLGVFNALEKDFKNYFDTSNSSSTIAAWLALPEGNYSLALLPENKNVDFAPITLNIIISAGITTNIGEINIGALNANKATQNNITGQISGKICLPDNTLIPAISGIFVYKAGDLSLESNLTLNDSGLFIINNHHLPPSNYGVSRTIFLLNYSLFL